MTSVDFDMERMKRKYTAILRQNGIVKGVKEVLITEPEMKGEHMASTCLYVTIKFTDESEDLELFIKKLVKNTFSETIRQIGMFDKEATFFNTLLPKAKQFCIKKTGNDELVDFFPKSYYGDDSLLVLENVVKRGYFMLDKFKGQSLDQAKFVLRNMAKIHGVFYSLTNDMGSPEFCEKYPDAVKDPFTSAIGRAVFGPMLDNNFKGVIGILQACDMEGSEKTVKWLKQFVGKVLENIGGAIYNNPEESLLVLNHGDCWNNNMMFLKNKETGELTSQLFVDLQVIRYGSPNLDIGYFLFTSVKPEIRRQQLIPLLKFYFEGLQETVAEFGASITISFDDFVENYKQKCGLGFWVKLVFMSTVGALKEFDSQKCGEDLEQMNIYFTSLVTNWFEKNREEAQNVCKDIIETVNEYIELTK